MAPQFSRGLTKQGRAISLRHRRCRIFVGPRTLEGVAARLYLAPEVAGFPAGAANLVELIVVAFELLIRDAPVLDGHVVVGDGFLAVTLLIVAFRQKVGRQEPPDLSVPVHATAADARAKQEGTEVAHRQRLLIDVVADGQRVIRHILKQMVTPHVAQLVLGEASGEVRGGVAPGTALQRNYLEAGIAELLSHDGPGPAETHQHRIDRFECRGHDQALRQPGRPLNPTAG